MKESGDRQEGQDMTLPRPWIPLDQDDELDGLTETDIEERIRSLKAQIAQSQANLRERDGRVEADMEAGALAEEVADELASLGQDAPADLARDANAHVLQEDQR